MKITPTVVLSLAFAAGLVAGLLGSKVISLAHAASDRSHSHRDRLGDCHQVQFRQDRSEGAQVLDLCKT